MYRYKLTSTFVTIASVIIIVVLSNPIACTSSNNSGSNDSDPNVGGVTRLTVSNLGKDIDLITGVPVEISFPVTYDMNRFGGPFSSLTLDLQAHLSSVTITVPGVTITKIPFLFQSIKTANAVTDGAELFLRVALAEEEATVCTDGELYGPFDISLADNFQPVSVTPATAEATQQTLDIINTGSYSVCVQIHPVITAVADLNTLIVDFGACDTPAKNIGGTWAGTYMCGGICPESGNVTMNITQNQNDLSIATYTDDGGASYEGRVCGNRFSYSGGLTSEYDESGTFTLNPDGSASKSSTYIDVGEGAFCTGTCTDELSQL